jgi:peptidylprolyl isomerase
MKKLLYLLSAILLFSCIKKEDDPQTKSEQELQDYLKKNNITTKPETSGLYYIETLAGSGAKPISGDYVLVNITGTLLNGNVIETNDSVLARRYGLVSLTKMQHPYKYALDTVGFPGVIEGIKLMNEGGKAHLIMPYKLGLGKYGTKNIPYYSNLIYDVELVKVIHDPALYDSLLVKSYISGFVAGSSHPDTVYILSETPGSGNGPADNDTVVIKYNCRTVDGIVTNVAYYNTGDTTFIDASHLPLGFRTGLKQMKPGGTATILIKYKYAYGASGSYDFAGEYYMRQVVPPYSSIIADVSLISVHTKK